MKKGLLAIIIIVSLSEAFFLSTTPDSTITVYPVAIVGNKAILSTELDRAMLMMYPGRNFADSSELWRAYAEVLDDLIDEELFYQAAISESMSVDHKAIDMEFSARWDSMVAQFGNESDLEKQLLQEGYTLPQFKLQMRRQIEAGFLKQMYVQRHIGQVDIAENEVAKFFEEHKDELPSKPASVGLWAKKFAPPPDDTLWMIALERAKSARDRLSAGEDFAKLAGELSDDRKTSATGGELGTLAESELPENFREAIKKLKAGQISDPTRGEKGVHILKLISRTGDKVRLAHIFFKFPSPQEGALWKAHTFAQSQPDISQFDSTRTEWMPLSNLIMWLSANNYPLPETTGGTIKKQILPPIILPSTDTAVVYCVAQFKPEEKLSLPDDKEIITNYARMQKFREKLQAIAQKLRKKIYVEIKDERLKLHK